MQRSVAVFLAFSLLFVACGAADEPRREPSAAQADDRSAGEEGDRDPYLKELLAWVPLAGFDNGGFVVFTDFRGAAQSLGVPQSECSSEDRAFDWVDSLTERNGWGLGAPRALLGIQIDPADLERQFGLKWCEMPGWVDWRQPGIDYTTVFRSETGPAAIEAAVTSNEEWKPLLDTGMVDGYEYWTWGDGLDLSFSRGSAARPNGVAGTFGLVSDGYYIRALGLHRTRGFGVGRHRRRRPDVRCWSCGGS